MHRSTAGDTAASIPGMGLREHAGLPTGPLLGPRREAGVPPGQA